MANEETDDTVKRKTLNVKRKRFDGTQELTRVFSGLRFTSHDSRALEVL